MYFRRVTTSRHKSVRITTISDECPECGHGQVRARLGNLPKGGVREGYRHSGFMFLECALCKHLCIYAWAKYFNNRTNIVQYEFLTDEEAWKTEETKHTNLIYNTNLIRKAYLLRGTNILTLVIP